jgi:hypothetical protein
MSADDQPQTAPDPQTAPEPRVIPGPPTEGAAKLVKEIRRTLNALVIATVVLFIALGAVGAYSYFVADQNRQAICNLKDDLEQRVQRSEDFVMEHPAAVKELGFTKAQIDKEILNQRRTLDALSAVTC